MYFVTARAGLDRDLASGSAGARFVPILRLMQGRDDTLGLEAVVQDLAEGVDPAVVLRTLAALAARACHGEQAVVVCPQPEGPAVVASFGSPDETVRLAADEALRHRAAARRSQPVAGVEAVAVPLEAGDQLLGVLAVGGLAGRLDEHPLGPLAAACLLTLRRHGARAQHEAVVDVLARVGAAPAADEVLSAALGAAEELLGTPAGLAAVPERGGLEVRAHRGLARDELGRLAGCSELHEAIGTLRHDGEARPVVVTVSGRPDRAVVLSVPVGSQLAAVLVVLVLDPTPEQLRLLATLGRHVTNALERVEAVRSLEEGHEEMAALVNATPAPVVAVDADGAFRVVNAAAAELFHLGGDLDVGRPARGRLRHAELERLLLDERGAGSRDVEIGAPSHAYRAVAADITGRRGGPLGRVVVLEDVTVARQHARARDDFVSVMGHELRTPLTVVQGFVQTMLAHGDRLDDEQRAMFLHKIATQSGLLAHLIEDVLFLSTERGRPPKVETAPAVLAAVVDGVVASLLDRHAGREVHVLALSEDLEVRLDRPKVEQVVRHLLDNALKYSDGPVTVELRVDDDAFEIAVVDQGAGIFSGDLESLFEPFVQGDSSSTRERGGAGIGLYVARRLVEIMGGRLTCDSRLGQGSRFSFRVPRPAPRPTEQSTSETVPA